MIDGDHSHTMYSLSSRWFSSLLVAVWLAGSSETRAETDTGLAFLCPIKVLQDAYAALADPTEALSALAIERHVLAICRESQLKLLEIEENNRRLAELFGVESVTITLPVETVSDSTDTAQRLVPAEKQPEFALQAIIRRSSRARALIRVDGVGQTVSEGDVLETGHRVVAVGYGVVELLSPAGTAIVVD